MKTTPDASNKIFTPRLDINNVASEYSSNGMISDRSKHLNSLLDTNSNGKSEAYNLFKDLKNKYSSNRPPRQ